METEYYDATRDKDRGTSRGAEIIRQGGLVAFPTETVYGLGANGLDGSAVKKIFEAKGRANDNPLILHVSDRSESKELWRTVTPKVRQLMDTFWPGPLTIVYYRTDIVPDEVTAALDTVAVRMSANKTALSLIRKAKRPIAAPSANRSGRPSPTTAAHVMEDLSGLIDVVIDGGPCAVGLESTVISMVGRPTLLRPGGITREMLEAVIGHVELAPSILAPLRDGEAVLSPGMKYKHYAPEAEVIVAEGSPHEAADKIRAAYLEAESEGKSCMIFASAQTRAFYRGKRYDIIGDRDRPETMAASLFSKLREHGSAVDVIFAEALDTGDIGLAYMNRLLRAAGFRVI